MSFKLGSNGRPHPQIGLLKVDFYVPELGTNSKRLHVTKLGSILKIDLQSIN